MNDSPGRTTLFARLDALARPAAFPELYTSSRSFEDPFRRFSAALEAVHGRAVLCTSLEGAIRAAGSVLAGEGVAEAVLNGDVPLEGAGSLQGVTLHRAADYADRPGEWRAACARAGAGITGADALLAETGSVALSSGPGCSRLVSLLPPLHLVIAPQSRLAPDLFHWLSGRDRTWPANTVLVSGPSKTADIEQTMSVGVHGPRKLIVFVYLE